MLFLTSGAGIVFIIKVFLHNYLDSKNNRYIPSSGVLIPSPDVFWFYRKPVTNDTLRLKRLCNFLYGSFLMLCLIMIIINKINF